jgi:3-oxoacyl-[acyl-carrier protein] reductase
MRALTGKVAIVTGASKGIGANIALGFADAGAAVVVNFASDAKRADAIVVKIKAAGGRAIAVQADVSKESEVKGLFNSTMVTFGRLDVLVNNAGVFHYSKLESVTEEDFHRQFNTNVLGVVLTTREALSHFSVDGGSIINIGSAVTRVTPATTAVYTATKFAVEGLTKVFAKELAPRKIRVNSVNPGAVDTEGVRAEGLLGGDWEKFLVSATPLGRLGTPEDITPSVLFLASSQSAWITGEVLVASGGL